MVIFGPKPWINPFKKNVNFSTFRIFFLQARKAFFRTRISLKTFSWPILPKKKVEKTAMFGPKPWVNPFKKNVNFSTFWTAGFHSLGRRFFVLEYHKRHFPGLCCLKKKLQKWPCLDQNHGLTHFGKLSIFRLFGPFVFIALKGVLRSGIS